MTSHLVYISEHGLGDLLTAFDVVVAVGENLRLDDGHDPVSLTDGCVTSQHVGVLDQGLHGRGVLVDLEDAAPFGEVAAVLLVLGAAFAQVVQTCESRNN